MWKARYLNKNCVLSPDCVSDYKEEDNLSTFLSTRKQDLTISNDLNKIRIWTNESINAMVQIKAALKQKYDAWLEPLHTCNFLNYSISTRGLKEGNLHFEYGYVIKPSPKLIQWQI
jgi:hypothetical protein